MSNTNTVAGYSGSGTLRNTWPVQTVNAATETWLQVNTDSGTPVNAFLVAPTGGQVLGAQTGFDVNGNASITRRSGRDYGLANGVNNDQFSTLSWDGHPFYVRLVGVGNAGANASQSVLFTLRQGVSTTLGTNTAIATTGAALAMVAGGAFNFFIEALISWDATSQVLSGYYIANLAWASASQIKAPTTLTSNVTSVTAAALSFVPSVTFGSAQATNTVTVREFLIERI